MSDEPTNVRQGIDIGKLFVGLLLVTLGVLFLFDRLFWMDLGEGLRLWPLWLMAFGAIRILFPAMRRHGRRASRLAGFWPLVIGGIFLMDTLHVMDLHQSWPLFIVGIGVLMVLRSVGGDACRREARS